SAIFSFPSAHASSVCGAREGSMAARLWFPIACSFFFFAACGGDGGGGVVQPSEIDVREGAPSGGTISAMSALEADAAVEALGIDNNKNVVAVAGAQTFAVAADALELRALYAGPGDPETTGTVHAVVPKMDGGAWIAADAGLFILDELYVLK